MSIAKLVRQSVATAFVLTLAGTAFARQPPSLSRAQAESQRAVCRGDLVDAGAGYRGARMAVGRSTQALRVSSGPGYRDAIARFGLKSSAIGTACVVPKAPRLSASR